MKRGLCAVSWHNPVLVVLLCSYHKHVVKAVPMLCSCWEEEDAERWEEWRLCWPG